MIVTEWPEDGSPLSLEEDLTPPLCQAVRFAYALQRRNRDADVPWDGPEIGDDEQANAPLTKCLLKHERLSESETEQNRDALTEIMGIAIRIGIEQGRRITKNSSEYKALLLQEMISSGLRRLLGEALKAIRYLADPTQPLPRTDIEQAIEQVLVPKWAPPRTPE
jgi:hypothetical protein